MLRRPRRLASRPRAVNNDEAARDGGGETRARGQIAMTYCVGIMTREGLVMASDSRTNASYDQVNVCRKMHTFVDPGERVFVLLTSGSLSCSQSILTLLGRDFDQGTRPGHRRHDVRRRPGRRRPGPPGRARSTARPWSRTTTRSTSTILLAGQIRGQPHDLYLVYPQGNPLRHRGFAVPPDRRVQVRPPDPRPRGPLRPHDPRRRGPLRPDLARLHHALERHRRPADRPARLRPRRPADHPQRRFLAKDPDLLAIHAQWEQSLRKAVQELPPGPLRRPSTSDPRPSGSGANSLTRPTTRRGRRRPARDRSGPAHDVDRDDGRPRAPSRDPWDEPPMAGSRARPARAHTSPWGNEDR